MDVSASLGAFGANIAYPNAAVPAPVPTAGVTANPTPSNTAAIPLGAAIEDAPSATPSVEAADSRSLPLAEQYAPSPAPRGASPLPHAPHFDRSA